MVPDHGVGQAAGPGEVPAILRHWRKDANLPTVRNTNALATLRGAERKDWQAFWVEYEALVRKVDEPQPR